LPILKATNTLAYYATAEMEEKVFNLLNKKNSLAYCAIAVMAEKGFN
jgi:hypothetical protein